jgi:general L-amino acid transport system permease protein
MAATTAPKRSGDIGGLLYRPEARRIAYQAVLLALVVALFAWIAGNLNRHNVVWGFDFLNQTAGFDVSQSLIEYSSLSTYGRVFWVGLLNTLLVCVLGIIAATVLGFAVGIARLSSNWLIARLAGAYVEVLRNVPLLLQLFFWYFAVLKSLPPPRQSYTIPESVGVGFAGLSFQLPLPFHATAFLNVRGLYLPAPVPQPGFGWVVAAFAAGFIATAAVWWWARRRQTLTGERFPVQWTALGVIAGLPLLAFLATGRPLMVDYPVLKGFNFQGGIAILPELIALWLGLATYTASFIAEIVRAGILGVPKGQTEAAQALGLTRGQTLRLVVIPQAARIIVPPLTSQYLNLTKNSSLAVAIGYPDFVSLFAGTVLNQSSLAVEVILITMGMFLALSLITSLLMNWFNRRMALVER